MEFLVKLFICLVYPEHPIPAGTDDKHRTDPSSGEKSGGIREPCNSVPNGQDQTPDETSENLEILNDEGRATAAVKRYGDQSKLYTPDTGDSKKSLTIPSGRPAVGNTLHTLSDSDLSVDARQCAVPRKKPKDKKLKDSKQADFEKDDLDVKKDKDSEHFKKDKSRNDDDLRDFIRALVQKEFSEKTEIKFFDAAIVYDKRDFDDVVRFKNELTDIVKTSIDDDLRIELFDSEEFAQSKIMVVEDVIDRCSVVLIYLSSNFTSPELHLFTEEAIGLSRLGYNDPEFQTGRMNSQRQWVLKPVHTKSQKSRDYKTPVGLLTVNGIDWFDRSSQHTKNQIISIMKEAVRQRKQKSMEINTNNAYKDMFGSLPSKPKLGPPFNKQRPVTKSMAQVPTTGEINPLISHPVEDAMSFPFFQRNPLLLNDYDLRQVAVQPRFQHDVTSSLRHDDRPYHMPPILHGNMAVQGKNLATQQRNDPRNLSYEYAPYGAQMPYDGYTEQQSDIVQREAVQLSYPTYESTPGSQHGYIYQSAGLQKKGKQTPQQGQLAVQTTSQPVTMQTGLAVSYPPQVAQPRSPMRSPDVHENPNRYLDRHVSQDALPSNSDSYMRDQNRDLQSTQMSIVSKITGNLILKSNLSTDDDIEVDSLHSDIKQRASSSHMTEGQSRGTRFSHGTADDTDDSDTSSGSDSDAEVPDGRKLVKKVVNIVGCKTVQLGKGNRVKETKKKHHASEDSSKKSENQSDSTPKIVKKETSNDIPGQASHDESSVLPMNISVSEDVRSMQERISRDLPHGKTDGYLSENMNKLSSPYAGITRNFHANETKPVNELNVNSENYPSNNMDRKQSSNFHFSIDEQGNDNNDRSSSGGNVWSPDDNITEEQLFGAGSVEGDENVSNLSSRAQEAPFSLSKFVGKTNFQDMVHISLNKTSDQTTIVSPNLYSELD